MHKPEEIRQLLSSWGELRVQQADEWQGDALQLPKEIADFYEQIGPFGPVIYESVGPVGITLSVGGNPVSIPPLRKLLNLQVGYAWQSDPKQGGFKPEVQHLPPSKVRRCHHLVRPRHTSNFSLKSASPLPA